VKVFTSLFFGHLEADKGKPAVRPGRKAMGPLLRIARPPKFAAHGVAHFITKPSRRPAPKPAHRPLTGFELLETRTVLSANLVPSASFDLAIRGTDIQYSPLGLPAAMGGDVYLAANSAASHAPIGRYQETLTPILMDINGDQVPDFVGTTGVATFSFFVGAPEHLFGSITTADTSYIQGVTPAGQLVVGSQGTIIASTNVLKNLSGGFVSQSTVGMLPTFEMQTNVHFTVNRPVGPAFTLLAIAADLVSTSNATPSEQKSDPVLPHNDRSSDHGVRNNVAPDAEVDQHDKGQYLSAKPTAESGHDAHDGIFADDVDWLPNGLRKDRSLV